MTIFGDLDISTLRELPAGRSPIQTHVISISQKPKYLERAWERIREEVSAGHQAYVVAPRIFGDEEGTPTNINERDRAMAKLMGETLDEEELDGSVGMSAVDVLAPELATGPLKGLKIAVLHGQLSSQDKEETMNAFAKNEISVLVATTVIEVGVDVPNASMMVIMDADRFGVSQLHQLRGRVGRGGVAGLCLLVSKAEPDSLAMDRLTAVASTLDGFELSRIDLDQRREGDVLGKAQSGSRSHLRLLRVLRDEPIIEKARTAAISLIAQDPTLHTWPHLSREVEILRKEESSQFVDKG
jgi:ATP-dependent DNA helicase RecG